MANNSEEAASAVGVVSNTQYILFLDIFCCVQAVMSSLGMVANVINIKTFIAMGLGDGVSVSFLALSLSDLGYLSMNFCVSVSQGLSAVEKKSGYATYFPIDPLGMYFFFAHTSGIFYAVTVMITTFLAIARCMCVVRPLHFKNIFTRKRCIYIILGFWVLSIGGCFPVFYYMGMLKRFDKNINASRPFIWISPKRELVKDIIWGLRDTFLAPITELVVIMCVIVMTRCLKEASRFRQSTAGILSVAQRHYQTSGSLKVAVTEAKDGNRQDENLNWRISSTRRDGPCNPESSERLGDMDQPLSSSDHPGTCIARNDKYMNAFQGVSSNDTEKEAERRDGRNSTVKDDKPPRNSEVFREQTSLGNVSLKTKKTIKDDGATPKKLGGKELQVVQQVVLISLVYVVCNSPKIAVNLVGGVEPQFTFGRLYNNIYLIMLNVCQLFQMFNSGINVFVYYHYNSKFRSLCKF